MLLLPLKRQDFVKKKKTNNIAWIRTRSRNRLFSKVGTGTRNKSSRFPNTVTDIIESYCTVVDIGVVCLVGNPLDDIEGEGADLLDGVDGDLVLEAALPPFLYQVVVHLA
jgi:hypothetical protein